MRFEWIALVMMIGGLLWRDLSTPSTSTAPMRRALITVFLNGSLVALLLIYLGLYEGPTFATTFLTAYVVELSLSMDNVFVFIIIFQAFKIPQPLQKRVLTWGIMGALLFRAIMILTGSWLLQKFSWILYVFGALLIWTALRMLKNDADSLAQTTQKITTFLGRFIPTTRDMHGEKFCIKRKDKWHATPLLMALCAIELTDLMFALDSIPAVLAITPDLFTVYGSNILAILCLRSLYILLEHSLSRLYYLHHSLAILLIFIGGKIWLSSVYHLPILWSLSIIGAILGGGIGASFLKAKRGA